MFNILVVEDNINNMRLFKQILSDVEKEMTITDAYTGNEAIEKSKNYVYDLVLMDIALPDMGGVETRRELIKTAISQRQYSLQLQHMHLRKTKRTWKRNLTTIFQSL